MKRRILLVALIAPMALWAAPAVAQDSSGIANLPGMGVVGIDGDTGRAPATGTTAGTRTGTAARPDLPATSNVLPRQDLGADAAPAITAETTPARARTADTGGTGSLPRTGMPIGALALLGISLVATGRLIIELVPRRS